MSRDLRTRLTAPVRSAMRAWHRIPMRTQGRITVGLPLVAVVISATLAGFGNYERVTIETDIQRKFEMTAALGDLTTLMVNAETGMRGYLLTGQGEYLDPFDQASRSLPSAIGHLNELAAAEPGPKPRADKLARVAHLRTLTDEQMADLAYQRRFVTAERDLTDPEVRQHLAYGKQLMDSIRVEVDAMQDEERMLLDDRIAEINGIRVRDYLSVALALLAALVTRFLAWYLFRNGTLRRVDVLTDTVRGIREGRPPAGPPTEKRDRLGELEREIHRIAEPARAEVPPRP